MCKTYLVYLSLKDFAKFKDQRTDRRVALNEEDVAAPVFTVSKEYRKLEFQSNQKGFLCDV